jgi:hypothetical protein
MDKRKYKTFEDLNFKLHSKAPGHIGSLNFSNGYGISIARVKYDPKVHSNDTINTLGNPMINGYSTATANEQEWEAVVLRNGYLYFDTYLTPKGVIGHLSDTDVTKVMRQIQDLEAVNG